MKSRLLKQKVIDGVIWRMSVVGTISAIAPGTSVTFSSADFVSYGQAYMAIRRLNYSAGYPEYEIAPIEDGFSYTVTRHASNAS